MKKLFWEDPYQTDIDSKVVDIMGNEVLLEETIIYSFSGGQESDTAWINDKPVLDSRIRSSGEILYKLEASPNFSVGDTVKSRIDWDKRYTIMKLHSATHMVLAALYDTIGVSPLIGANVSSDKGRLDFTMEDSISPLLSDITTKVNDIILSEKPISTDIDEDSSNPEGRLWLIEDLSEHWKIPCGGTHPRSASEIGSIKLKRKNIGAGKERIEIKLYI